MTQMHSRSLPTEIWAMVLMDLPLEDCKQFRSANREYWSIATPFCFRTLTFDISVASLRNLERVTLDDELRLHTQTLVLKRRKRMRNFHSQNDWEHCSSLADNRGGLGVGMENAVKGKHAYDYTLPIDRSSIWADGKDALYDQYERERTASDAEIRSLADQLCFRRPGCNYVKQVHPHNSQGCVAGRHDLARLDETLAKFTELKAFIHKPLVLSEDRWVTVWEGLRLDPYTFDNTYDEDCRQDEDWEAFHLSYILRALGWAKPSLIHLTSMTIHVEGPAFWGPRRLQRLWAGEGHDEIRRHRKISNDAVEADAVALTLSQNDARDEEFMRQLVLMESTVQGLSHIDCSVSEDEENGGLFTAAGPLFEYLCYGSNLRRVRLAFGWLVDGHVLPDFWIREHGDGPKELLTLLIRSSPWSKIEELELQLLVDGGTLLAFLASLSATLRRLALHNVTLFDESWESVLPAIVECLPELTHLDVSTLCDRSHDQISRVIFDPQAQIWSGKSACFDDFKSITIDRLLRKEAVQSMESAAFLREHSHACRHI